MAKLDERESKVLKYVCEEKTNIEISEKIKFSLRQTEKIKNSLYKKTGAKSAIGLFKWAVRNGYFRFKV